MPSDRISFLVHGLARLAVLILSVRLVQTIGPSLHAEFSHPNSTQDCLRSYEVLTCDDFDDFSWTNT